MLSGPLVVLYKNDPVDPSKVDCLPCETFVSTRSYEATLAGINYVKDNEPEIIDITESKEMNTITVFCLDHNTNLGALNMKLHVHIDAESDRQDAIYRAGRGNADERLEQLQELQDRDGM